VAPLRRLLAQVPPETARALMPELLDGVQRRDFLEVLTVPLLNAGGDVGAGMASLLQLLEPRPRHVVLLASSVPAAKLAAVLAAPAAKARGNDGGDRLRGDALTLNRPLLADRGPIPPPRPGACGFAIGSPFPIYRRCVADSRSMGPPMRCPPLTFPPASSPRWSRPWTRTASTQPSSLCCWSPTRSSAARSCRSCGQCTARTSWAS
ncbi:unnamed protein product, partial [Prorocentrum cordatum]